MAATMAATRTRPASKRSSWRGRLAGNSAVLKTVSLLVLLGLWWAASFLIPARIVPSPFATAQVFLSNLEKGQVTFHLSQTFTRVAIGFAFSMVIGVAVGSVMGLSRLAERVLDVWVMVALTIPGLAFVVVSLMALGLNEGAAVVAIILSGSPIIIVNMWQGVKNIDNRLVDMARSFDATFKKRFFGILIPQILPYIVASARLGLGLIWKVVVVVELLGRNNGVGFQLYYWFQLYNMAQVFAWIAVFTVVMLTIEFAFFKPLENRLFRWRPIARL